MNKKGIIICIAAIIVIGGGVAAYLLTKDSKDDTVANNQSQSSTDNANTTNESSIADSTISKLLSAGVARKCTYNDASTSGTIYLASNNRMRADYTVSSPESSSGSMILTNGQHYMWDNATKEGISMSYDPASVDNSTDDTQSVDMSKEYSFDCNLWIVDESVLTPPADVTFSDMSALMEQHAH
jgi:hypothetical protein